MEWAVTEAIYADQFAGVREPSGEVGYRKSIGEGMTRANLPKNDNLVEIRHSCVSGRSSSTAGIVGPNDQCIKRSK